GDGERRRNGDAYIDNQKPVCDPAIMTNIDDEIRIRTASFAKDIAVLVRRLALESVTSALGQPRAPEAPVREVAAPPPARGAAAPRARRAAPKAAPSRAPVTARRGTATKRTPGEKRPPGELVKLTEKLGDYIKSNPGRRMEVITKALGTPTRDLNLP